LMFMGLAFIMRFTHATILRLATALKRSF